MMKSVEHFTSRALGAPVAVSGELKLMREGMVDLIDLLSHARPHGSEGELTFLKDWLIPRLKELGAAPDFDGFGNLWSHVPATADYDGPAILWSCHVDTVHKPKHGPRQGVRWAEDGRTIELVKRKAGRCLGADDGAGVWLLLRMIEAGVPGGYVFHRGEEVGRLGSTYVSETEPERLTGYDACVAFDRRDYADLITHQMGERCASEAFAESFAGALNAAGRCLKYRADDTGSYTDSYSYAGQISECCNVSVGYDSEHGPRETLDALHLWRLCEAVCTADLSLVTCERDPTVIDYAYYGYGGGYGGNWASGGREGNMRERMDKAAWGDDLDWQDGEELLELVRRYPRAVAELLDLYGLDGDCIAEHLTDSELAGAVGSGLIGLKGAKTAAGGWVQD